MATMVKLILMLITMVKLYQADMYLHNPRGSNNRLNENSRERRNGNRLFDSQNNNRGGYNVGNVYYLGGSILPIQWTNQHSCSDPNNNCEIIIQYMCSSKLRDGTITSTIPDNDRACLNKEYDNDFRFGMHEDCYYYLNCKKRERNKGLFTADQNLKGQTAKYTRQNPDGTRRGYECPEERDYYPYWQPTPWKDIVVLTNDESRCLYYQQHSQNTKSKSACFVPTSYLNRGTIPINKESCEEIAGATWKDVPAHGIPPPDCRKSPWSRDNHHGNGIGGYMNVYNWTVPDIQEDNCAIRIRYNISTNDFDSWRTFSDKNGNNPTKVDISNLVGLNSADASSRGYVYKNNPTVQVSSGSNRLQLQLAINTAQYGRTFQDRSHAFEIRKRPSELKGKRIYNVNVRGKRGNIVQVYPAVEYDFVPNTLRVEPNDYIHFQWTGSNTNPGNNAGQGRHGTDRSNIVLLSHQAYPEGKPKDKTTHGQYGRNYPEKIEKDIILGLDLVDIKKLAFIHPGAGDELNEAGTYFDLGPKKVTSAGIYHYMSTRNNNFSNRSQKGKIIVRRSTSKDEQPEETDNESQKDLPEDSKMEHFKTKTQKDEKENIWLNMINVGQHKDNRIENSKAEENEKRKAKNPKWVDAMKLTNTERNDEENRVEKTEMGEPIDNDKWRNSVSLVNEELKKEESKDDKMKMGRPMDNDEWSNSVTLMKEEQKKDEDKKDEKIQKGKPIDNDNWSNSVTLVNKEQEKEEDKKDEKIHKGEPMNIDDWVDSDDLEKKSDVVNKQTKPAETTEWTNNMHFSKPIEQKPVKVTELSREEGEKILQDNGGVMEKDDGYASDYLAVYPMKKLSDINLNINLRLQKDVDPEYVTVYHSPDMKTWYPVENQDIVNGKAMVKVQSGGLYVARVTKNEIQKAVEDLPKDQEFFSIDQ